MAHYARKLRYGAHDGEAGASYMALLQLAKKKGGPTTSFVLYSHVIQYNFPKESTTKMFRFTAGSIDEAIKRFWPWDHDDGGGKEFPEWRSGKWQETTLWLDYVAVGGAYEGHGYEYSVGGKVRFGSWTKVGTPAPWSKRRSKKPLQVGNISHILIVRESHLSSLRTEKDGLEDERASFESYDDEYGDTYVSEENQVAHNTVQARIDRLEEEVDAAEDAVSAVKAEMRYKVRQLFPYPKGLIPKRRLRLQYEESRRARGWR